MKCILKKEVNVGENIKIPERNYSFHSGFFGETI